MSADQATDFLKQLCIDMGVQLEQEWELAMRELRKKFLEKALDGAINMHPELVASADRLMLLNSLDPGLFPLR